MKILSEQNIDRYHIIEPLGEGGMAVVYKAFDTRLDRDVAVKIIRSDIFGSAAIENILRRFDREVRVMSRLSHPNIVKVLDYGKYEGNPFLVMELLTGGTLKDRLGTPLTVAQSVNLLLPIVSALAYAHDQHVLHRDVKPSNILMNREGEPVLTDFGIAKLLDIEEKHTLTGTGVGVGTPEYMAPEQGLGHEVDARADVYSLGIVLYELVTGHKPYTADTPLAVLLKQVHDPLPSPRTYQPDLPQATERVIYKALAKEPEYRYQSMREFGEALSKLLEATPGTDPGVQPINNSESNLESITSITVEYIDPKLSSKDEGFPPPLNNPASKTNKSLPNKVLVFSLLGIALLTLLILAINVWFSPPKIIAEEQVTQTNTLIPTSNPTNTKIPSTPTAIKKIGATLISDKDMMTMMYIPTGEFLMGSPEGEGDDDEHPQHALYLSSYWIDKTEITNAMFQKFTQDTDYQTYAEQVGFSYHFVGADTYKTDGADWRHPQGPSSSIDGLENHPVVHVTWNDAAAYCSWAGKRLPTEAEWERAARGTEGYRYPWGNELACEYGNFDDETIIDRLVIDYANCDGYPRTAPVGSFQYSSNSYGVLDLSGNVWEWTSDWYAKDYYSWSPYENPKGANEGEGKVVRGGSWYADKDFLRSSYRNLEDINFSVDTIGFRCVLAD